MHKKNLCFIALLLVIVGGFNWLLIGLFDFNVVTFILADFPMIEKLIYILVGISTIYSLHLFKTLKKH